jgi:RNA polymerase sigma factor (sigma-70 family)
MAVLLRRHDGKSTARVNDIEISCGRIHSGTLQAVIELVSPRDPKPAELLPGLPLGQCERDLQRYFSRRLGNRQDVRELTQEVWLRLCRVTDPHRVREPMAYVYRTAANVLAEFMLRRRRESAARDGQWREQDAAALGNGLADELAERTQAQYDLLNALGSLPTAYQRIVRMRLCEQCSFAEIAAAVGFTEATTRRYYFHAIKALWKAEWE